jgi:membrane-associated phospholipid phosphatase
MCRVSAVRSPAPSDDYRSGDGADAPSNRAQGADHRGPRPAPCPAGGSTGGTLAGVVALRRVRPEGWWWDLLLLLGFAAVTVGVASRALIGLDLWVRDWCDAHRPGVGYWLGRAANLLGQGGWLTGAALVLAGFLVWRRHTVRPLLPVATAFVLTFATLTVLKVLTERPAPHAYTAGQLTRGYFGGGGASYPSGHLVNAIVWYGVLALLLGAWLPERWRLALRVAPPAILFFSTVYLGYHWLTDTVAGVLFGLVLDRLLHRLPWDDLPPGRRLAGTGWAGAALGPQP